MAAQLPIPEQYRLLPTRHCPNNVLPVLVYRNVLPEPRTEESVSAWLQRHGGWVKKARLGIDTGRGTWGAITIKHFHPNTHECYGIFQGESELVFGECGADEPGTGARCVVRQGDVVVVPAGVAHASVHEDRSRDREAYRYIGVYPADAPKWRNEMGSAPADQALAGEAGDVPIPPLDPVYGAHGPLPSIWTSVKNAEACVQPRDLARF